MSEQQPFNVIVIGGGPGGYVAAIRAAQLGLSTLCIDDRQTAEGKPAPGGTCLNIGCIPSKALLDSTKHFHHLQHQYQNHGIQADNVRMDVATMVERKNKVVKQLTGGVTQLFKANKVTYVNGRGKLLKDRQVEVTDHDGTVTTYQGEQIILAAGSVPINIPNVEVDNQYILDNEGALDMAEVPKRLGVIGAGVIGLELGSVWNRLGSEVVLFEALDQFLAACDSDISKQAAREFKKQGLDVRLGTKVRSAQVSDGQVQIVIDGKDGEEQLTVDRLLVAVGRRAASENLLADDCGVQLDDRGRVQVDEHCRTSVDGVWAVGDLIRGPMLAHKASEEGIAVAETIAGQAGHVNLETVPWVIYTDPEIAWVGQTEQQLKEAGVDYKSGSFPFAATGRGLAMGDAVGLVKILADAESDEVLGVHIMGANASELIAECVVTMEFAGSAEDLARIVHAHPTLSEAVHEAALHVDKRAIHRAN
ncbi:MAG: dihydrolipoyl dehydrogenase [Wenzhouxiangellaceae bacterium]